MGFVIGRFIFNCFCLGCIRVWSAPRTTPGFRIPPETDSPSRRRLIGAGQLIQIVGDVLVNVAVLRNQLIVSSAVGPSADPPLQL